ncbi:MULTISPECIES: hypothetical protein [unclassified Caballeronia]|uniref:hypothetical protein n=1 Tax=unclassified Caballeronia TaxID=2646786 RepID=UPI002029956F|nr:MULTISPECIES: hypothetical protein [unclassified Caballeronia]
MKSRLVMAAVAASLLATAGVASAQQSYYRTAQVPGQATPDTWTQSADTQSQTGDMSYGGVSSTRSDMGSAATRRDPISKPCTRGPQCDIFFGN